MFVIVLNYTAPLDEIDRNLPAHAAWLDTHYETGRFLASGRQEPRTGGVILASGGTREEIERIAELDPFHVLGLAEHRVIEFTPTRAVPELVPYLD